MQIERVMKYLDQNISDVDRKTYNKLLVHIKKRHTRTLNQLISAYNIDRKKFIFASGTNLNDKYMNKLDSLIDMCRHIIENKINISEFNAESFHIGKCLDISSANKIDAILTHLYSYNTYYKGVSVSKELLKNPLLILTISTKKRLDLGLLEKYAYDFASTHALVEDKVQPVHTDLSAVNTYKKNYILDKNNNALVEEVIVKEAILDYFKSTGEFFYVSSDDEQKISRDVNAMIESKSHFDASTSNLFYKIFELILPITNVGISVLFLLFSAIAKLVGSTFVPQIVMNVFMYLLILYSLCNIGLFIYRVKVLTQNKNSFCYNYYLKYPTRLRMYQIITFGVLIIQISYVLIFNDFYSIIQKVDLFMSNMYKNTTLIYTVTGILLVLGVCILGACFKFFRHQLPKISYITSVVYAVIIFFIRTNILHFSAFKGVSILFSTFSMAILLLLVLEQNKKVKYAITLGIIVIDLLLVFILKNEFYLRFLFG